MDAVCAAPCEAHPFQMAYRYFFETREGTGEYFQKYVCSEDDFAGYLELVGGEEKLAYLERVEILEESTKASWLRKKGRR